MSHKKKMMKKILFTLVIASLTASISFSQNRTLPNIELKNLNGTKFNITQIENEGSPIVISFWATWCKPCKKELNNIMKLKLREMLL